VKKRHSSKSKKKTLTTTIGSKAMAAHQSGNYQLAEQLYSQLLSAHPNNNKLLTGLGQVCIEQKKPEQALQYLEKSYAISNDDSNVVYHLALAHQLLGDHNSAITFYLETIAKKKDFASALNNLSSIYYERMNYSEAEQYLTQLLTYHPDHVQGLANLGLVLLELGKTEEAINLIKRSIALQPNLEISHSNLLLDMHYLEHNAQQLYQEHLNWSRRHAAKNVVPADSFSTQCQNHKRIRVGYISPDFRQHSVAYFFIPILKSHDHQQFDVYCYSNAEIEDEVTQHIQSMSPNWRKTNTLNDQQLAEQIKKDEIDIVIELSGHSSFNRLSMLSQRVAPIQITYLGYPNTTGLSTMDYRITDIWADPLGESDALHTETLLRLENGFLCYKPPSNIPDPNSIPYDKNGHITFGSFNTLPKISDQTLDLWVEVLQRVENSRLFIKAKGLTH
jgi:predicted O-linked N-acetylglucosamine transferase (SPINDLY family)